MALRCALVVWWGGKPCDGTYPPDGIDMMQAMQQRINHCFSLRLLPSGQGHHTIKRVGREAHQEGTCLRM